jgi:hypothetical protein
MLKSTVPTFIGRVVTYLKNSEGFNHLLTFGDYASRLAVLFGVASYFYEASDRAEQRHYQAWQLIDIAYSKSGDGGRRQA